MGRKKTIKIVGHVIRSKWRMGKPSHIEVRDQNDEVHTIGVDHTEFMHIVNRAGYSLATLNHPTRLSEEGKNVRHGPNGSDPVKFKSVRQRNTKILGAVRSYKKLTRFECQRDGDGNLVLKSSTVRGVEA